LAVADKEVTGAAIAGTPSDIVPFTRSIAGILSLDMTFLQFATSDHNQPAVLKVVAGTNFWDSQIVRKMIHHMDEAVAIPSVGFEGGLRLLSGSP
jgi:hypothetical protein